MFETAYQELLELYEVNQPQDSGMPSQEEFFELVWRDLKKRLKIEVQEFVYVLEILVNIN